MRSSEESVRQLRRFGEGGGNQRGSDVGRGGPQGFAGVVREDGRGTGGCRAAPLTVRSLSADPLRTPREKMAPQFRVSTTPCLWHGAIKALRGLAGGSKVKPRPRRRSHHETTCVLPGRGCSPELVFSVSRGGPLGGPGLPVRCHALDERGLSLCAGASGTCVETGLVVSRLYKGVRRSKARPRIRCLCGKTPCNGAAGPAPLPGRGQHPQALRGRAALTRFLPLLSDGCSPF